MSLWCPIDCSDLAPAGRVWQNVVTTLGYARFARDTGHHGGVHPDSSPGGRDLPAPIRWEKTTAVATKIKLKRLGKIRAPYYRIVVADARTKRDGRVIETIGKYHPKEDPSLHRGRHRPCSALAGRRRPADRPGAEILEITGDWQKFKGLPGSEGTLRTAEPRADRKAAFAAALRDAGLRARPAEVRPPRSTRAKKAEAQEPKAAAETAAAAEAPAAEVPAAEAPAAEVCG